MGNIGINKVPYNCANIWPMVPPMETSSKIIIVVNWFEELKNGFWWIENSDFMPAN